MSTELRNAKYGSTIERNMNLVDELAYALRAGDEVVWAGGACYVIVRKHWCIL